MSFSAVSPKFGVSLVANSSRWSLASCASVLLSMLVSDRLALFICSAAEQTSPWPVSAPTRSRLRFTLVRSRVARCKPGTRSSPSPARSIPSRSGSNVPSASRTRSRAEQPFDLTVPPRGVPGQAWRPSRTASWSASRPPASWAGRSAVNTARTCVSPVTVPRHVPTPVHAPRQFSNEKPGRATAVSSKALPSGSIVSQRGGHAIAPAAPVTSPPAVTSTASIAVVGAVPGRVCAQPVSGSDARLQTA